MSKGQFFRKTEKSVFLFILDLLRCHEDGSNHKDLCFPMTLLVMKFFSNQQLALRLDVHILNHLQLCSVCLVALKPGKHVLLCPIPYSHESDPV